MKYLPTYLLSSLSILLLFLTSNLVLGLQAKENRRDFQKFDTLSLSTLSNIGPAQWDNVNEGHLGKLLIPRAAGSENSTLVQNYISSIFSNLGWHEDKNTFTDKTPIGDITFTNLIYTFDPTASRRIVLTAHYDSKWFPDFPQNQFIGATDSAAPCAMLLDLAESLTPLLKARHDRVTSQQGILRDGFDEEESSDTTLTILFLDGEEAFHDWTDTDSIYGARHLSQLWQDTYPDHHEVNGLGRRRYDPLPTYIETIDHFILLDLLGNSHSRLHSYYRETDWLFDEMADVDRRLREEGLVEVESGEEEWFQKWRMRPNMIGDDHLPFVQKGVSVLHVISNPFPEVWHTLGDDASVLSIPAMRRWNRILRIFTAEYLGLVMDGVNVEERPTQKDELVRCLYFWPGLADRSSSTISGENERWGFLTIIAQLRRMVCSPPDGAID